MLDNAALPPKFNIELATGRVCPKVDKGLLDPPAQFGSFVERSL